MTSTYIPIQGSIANIVKVAMLHMQWHDEVVPEVAPGALEATRELVVKTINQAVERSAPLVAEARMEVNWMASKQGFQKHHEKRAIPNI